MNQPTREPIRITFVGNEGVVADSASGCVAIDVLFGDGAADYTEIPRGVIDAVEAARPPFDEIDVALATHFHPDHFNVRSVARHLENNRGARFLSTPQSAQALEEKATDFDAISDRVLTTLPEPGTRETITMGEIRVDAFRLSHGRVNFGDVEHLGFIVYLDGRALLHLGDGIIHEKALRDAGVLDEAIDIAFLPFWYLTYPFGKRLIKSHLRPTHVFAVHLPLEHQARIEAEVRETLPRAVPLRQSMSRHTID